MEVAETITRQCCDPDKDFTTYTGATLFGPGKLCPDKFCVHCGQLWMRVRSSCDLDKWERMKGDSDAEA